MRGWLLSLAWCLSFLAAGATPTAAQPGTGRLTGLAVDATGHVLPDTTIAVRPVGAAPLPPDGPITDAVASTQTNETGRFAIEQLGVGTYMVIAEREGYARSVLPLVVVREQQASTVRVLLKPAGIFEVVDVVASTGAGNPIETDDIQQELLRVFQLRSDRFQDALPLLPGVIRDSRGRLSFNGTRPTQSTLLVNGTNATDPVTGQFAFELPLSVIETVEVHAIPYSAEFGQVSGAVASVTTIAGDDHWDFEVGSLFPTPRVRSGTLMGINTATPRVKISGPLRRGSLWFTQAFDYRFTRSRVREPLPGGDEEIVEGFDAFSQFDLRLNERHSITGTVSFFPTSVENVGINSLHPAVATPDTESSGWNVAVVDELATSSDAIWQTKVAVRGFGTTVRPKGAGPSQLTPDGLRHNYFNDLDRHSYQLELGTARLRNWRWGDHDHLVKMGVQLVATSFDGIDRSGPIEVRGADGRLLKRISFLGSGKLDGSDVITSGYLQDHWQVSPRLALDLGLRYDYDAMLGEIHASPRTAFSFALDQEGNTLVKGGWGLFFDRTFLHVDAFESFQQRVEQSFEGPSAGPPVVLENRVDPEGLEEPISRVWNLEFDKEFGESVLLRVNYRENRARERLVVDRVIDRTGAALVLSSSGSLTGREFDATVRWTLAREGHLFVSFSKIRTSGDLNDFGLLYDNLRDPLVFENEETLQPFEVPNRLLLWGLVRFSGGLTVTPGIEWRTGFPYTQYDEQFSAVGVRNTQQFPAFFSADVAVTKRVSLFGREIDLGVQVYNLSNHDNPRDVVSNLASPRFGELRNSVGTSLSLKVGLEL